MIRTAVLALSAYLLAIGATSAQSNMLVIDQSGAGNRLTVDQSRASDSSVGGLTLDPAFGDVANSPVQSVARQVGSNNVATVTLTGTGGSGSLLQNNGLPGLGAAGNRAFINATGGADATVVQQGAGNRATINVNGELGSGTVLQNGAFNKAWVEVLDGGSGTIVQNGSNNSRSLSVAGDTNVQLVQNGSGLTDATSNAAVASAIATTGGVDVGGVQVISNAASVQITQTAMPGIGSR